MGMLNSKICNCFMGNSVEIVILMFCMLFTMKSLYT